MSEPLSREQVEDERDQLQATVAAAQALFDELFWRNSTATNDGYDEISLGVIEKYLTQAEQRGEQRGMERAAKETR